MLTIRGFARNRLLISIAALAAAGAVSSAAFAVDLTGIKGTAVVATPDANNQINPNQATYYDPVLGRAYVIDGQSAGDAAHAAMYDVYHGVLDILDSTARTDATSDNVDPYSLLSPRPQTSAEGALQLATTWSPRTQYWATGIGGGSTDAGATNGWSGIAMGAHGKFGADQTLGATAGIFNGTTTTTPGGLTVTTSGAILGVYGRWNVGDLELLASFIGVSSTQNSVRQITVLGAPETMRGTVNTFFIAPTVGVAMPVLVTDSGELKVEARAGYIGGGAQWIQEDSPSLQLVHQEQQIQAIEGQVGISGKTSLGSVVLTGKAGVLAQNDFGNTPVPIWANGLPPATFQPIGGMSYGVYAGAGIAVPVSDMLTLDANLDASWRSTGTIAGAARLGVTASF